MEEIMAKTALTIRDLACTPEFINKIQTQLTTDTQVTPGQLRKKGEWYYLTYLKTAIVKNFDPEIWELVEQEIDCIKVAIFKIHESGKLIVNGSKSDVNEINNYFNALTTNVATGGVVNPNDSYTLLEPTIDLGNIIKLYEDAHLIEYVSKTKMKDMEVTLGTVNSCMINTKDFYDKVRSLITEDSEHVMGIEIFLKNPAKTSVYYGVDGTVRVTTKSNDVDTETLAIRFALLDLNLE
jgi:hypothetical protein